MAYTVTEIIDNARDKYNGTGDTFFSDARLYEWLTEACNIIARDSHCIEGTSTTATVASTSDYVYPTNLIEIKRLTYDGRKLQPISLREYDTVSMSGSTATTTGTPVFYTNFDDTVSLYPIPDAIENLVFYGYYKHSNITSAVDTITIPDQFQLGLVDHLLMNMYAKDKDLSSAQFYENRFMRTVVAANKYMKNRKRGDGFSTVQSEELLPTTILGAS